MNCQRSGSNPSTLFTERSKAAAGTSQAVWWIRICLPMQETWLIPGPERLHVQGSNKAQEPNTVACAPRAGAPQQEKPPG